MWGQLAQRPNPSLRGALTSYGQKSRSQTALTRAMWLTAICAAALAAPPMRSSVMLGGTWWASRARQVTTCERFRTGWLKSPRCSLEFVSCIQAEELSGGGSPVGFWNPLLVWLTTRCISFPSTFLGTIMTSSLVFCSASVRRLSCWQGAFKTSLPSCEHAIVGPVPYVRWRRLLPAFVLFLLNLGRQRMESSGRASGSLK
jgi:hypothetical protein